MVSTYRAAAGAVDKVSVSSGSAGVSRCGERVHAHAVKITRSAI